MFSHDIAYSLRQNVIVISELRTKCGCTGKSFSIRYISTDKAALWNQQRHCPGSGSQLFPRIPADVVDKQHTIS